MVIFKFILTCCILCDILSTNENSLKLLLLNLVGKCQQLLMLVLQKTVVKAFGHTCVLNLIFVNKVSHAHYIQRLRPYSLAYQTMCKTQAAASNPI